MKTTLQYSAFSARVSLAGERTLDCWWKQSRNIKEWLAVTHAVISEVTSHTVFKL